MSPPHQKESCGSSPAPAPAVVTVDVTAARELLISGQNHHRYLDVRTEEELAKLGYVVEVDKSLNVPYMFITPQGTRVKNAEFVEQVGSLLMSRKEEHVIVGFTNVKNMGGGYLAWLQHGFPVHHPAAPAVFVPGGDMATTSPPAAGTQA